jgi:hypothetical protein
MQDQVPEFSDEDITKIANDLYGLEGEISSLVSFEDQNALIKVGTDNYVLKIANTKWTDESLHLQIEVLERLAKAAPELNLPKVIPTKAGDTITKVDGFPVRLLTFVKGNILGAGARSPALCQSLGRFMGRFSTAMQGYDHPGAERPDFLWNLDNIMACKQHLGDVVRAEDRDRIARFYENYEKNILPKLRAMRKSVIHADANEQNLLVSAENPEEITSLIDFGDLMYATHINELAITLGYTLLGVDDVEPTASQIIKGYEEEFPLEEVEREVVMGLAAMRLVQSIILSSQRAKEFPENEYIIISQKPARELLAKLEEITFR